MDKTKKLCALSSLMESYADDEDDIEDESYEFDRLFTMTRPHILEMICLSLDYETFKNYLRVNKAWRGVLTNKGLQPKVKSTFREEIANEENKLVEMSRDGDIEGVRRILSSGLVNVNCEYRLGE